LVNPAVKRDVGSRPLVETGIVKSNMSLNNIPRPERDTDKQTSFMRKVTEKKHLAGSSVSINNLFNGNHINRRNSHTMNGTRAQTHQQSARNPIG
jgi:hypothetical protein